MITSIEWRLDEPPQEEEVIVSIRDDNGDTPYYYTTTGWYFKGNWIVDNQICYNVNGWAPLPKPIKEIQDIRPIWVIETQEIVTATCPKCGYVEYLVNKSIPKKCANCGLELQI